MKNFDDISLVLRYTDHLCTLLSYQTDQIKNSYLLRVSLITHVFTEVIPLPLPRDHAKLSQCLWYEYMIRII